MNRADPTRPAGAFIGYLAAGLCLAVLTGCGSGGGGPSIGTLLSGDGIALASITFPKSTDLSGAVTTPPASAPLSQQVVFTFTGSVQGGATSKALQIHAQPGPDYQGPEAALDPEMQLITARGTYEKMGNVVVFTPFIPLGEIDLSPNAKPDRVPGLLPGYTYRVFVPVGTDEAIENLVLVAGGVSNPAEFTTVPETMPSLFFSNHPKLPPRIVSTYPADGAVDVPVNTFSDLGFPPYQDIVLKLDQPLDFSFENLEGIDQNQNGVRDQHLFLEYGEPLLYSAVDRGMTQPGYIAGLDTEASTFELVGYTNHESTNVGLQSVVLLETHEMLGCDGARLFDVDYENQSGIPPVCALTHERILNPSGDYRGLVQTREGELYALGLGGGMLVRIDPETGLVELLGKLPPGLGDFLDLALGRDDALYGLRVFNPGSPSAAASIERIDRATFESTSIVPGLQGDFTSIAFSRDGEVLLFDASALRWIRLDLASGLILEFGQKIVDPMLPAGSRLDFDLRRYELGVTPVLLDNSYHGATVRLDPSGILPFGTWIDVMARHSLENLSGGSMAKNLDLDPLGAAAAARFRTFDPGPGALEDAFLEVFLDNVHEEIDHDLAHSKAMWNVQDKDNMPPHYMHLLAGLGLSGSGELGDFIPLGNQSYIYLDTDYQVLPLLDGSTPDIHEPMVIQNGEFHFHDILIPEGVTVMALGSHPLVFTATGRVEIHGTIDVSGQMGGTDVTWNLAHFPTPGGNGGPGGGRGGMGQPPCPPDFVSILELKSPPGGERGWGPGDLLQSGGDGGESGANGIYVSWGKRDPDPYSRGAGGGGGSFGQDGHEGYPGKGMYGADGMGGYPQRDPWDYWDGSWEYDKNWQPGDPYPPRINEWFDLQHPHPGEPGEPAFTDGDPGNDYLLGKGELKQVQGGEGGGGGGSRLDSMNPQAQAFAANWNLPASAMDAKGGGGGGGGGCIAIHCLGEIIVKKPGRILARGGRGGGGEDRGHSNFGGGGGGGSGGAILLNSAERIVIEFDEYSKAFAILDVSGGWGSDAKEEVSVSYGGQIDEPCEILESTGKLMNGQFCTWSQGDGGCGGHGLVQLMVPDPSDPDQLSFHEQSVEAVICVIDHEPNYKKSKGKNGWSFYHYTVEGLGPGGTKPFIQHFPTTADCLVDPMKTPSTIQSRSYAVSRWIDTGSVSRRPEINGKKPPLFADFEGIKVEESWGVVITKNGFVINAHIPDFNDIEVDAPDLGIPDFIPDTNEAALQFQGTNALIPGSKVPDEDPSAMTAWTWDLHSLSGKQFFRFRVRLDVAKDIPMHPQCTKPQVNKLRVRMQY